MCPGLDRSPTSCLSGPEKGTSLTHFRANALLYTVAHEPQRKDDQHPRLRDKSVVSVMGSVALSALHCEFADRNKRFLCLGVCPPYLYGNPQHVGNGCPMSPALHAGIYVNVLMSSCFVGLPEPEQPPSVQGRSEPFPVCQLPRIAPLTCSIPRHSLVLLANSQQIRLSLDRDTATTHER